MVLVLYVLVQQIHRNHPSPDTFSEHCFVNTYVHVYTIQIESWAWLEQSVHLSAITLKMEIGFKMCSLNKKVQTHSVL